MKVWIYEYISEDNVDSGVIKAFDSIDKAYKYAATSALEWFDVACPDNSLLRKMKHCFDQGDYSLAFCIWQHWAEDQSDFEDRMYVFELEIE